VSKRRVVVTGLGMVSPLGVTVDETWAGILAGTSGVKLLDKSNSEIDDISAYSCRFAATVSNHFNPEEYISSKDVRKTDKFIHYGVAAAVQAIKDSGFPVLPEQAHRIGVMIGSGIGGLGFIEKNDDLLKAGGPRKVAPSFIPGALINMISGHVSIMYGLQGPNLAIVTACTTGAHNIGMAARLIGYGDADVMVAGGAEQASTRLGMSGFAASRALSTRNDDPAAASRPWDKDRDGFVLGDGAGVIVLEEYEHAKRRDAHIYAELIGFGMSGDAFHITRPPDDAAGAYSAMKNALQDADIGPEAVQYVNAHATSTLAGDELESLAIHRCFGDQAKKLAVSSTKSMTGHLLGAAGAIEAIFSILAIRDSVAPPTTNLHAPSAGCDLDYVPNEARPMAIKTVLSNSFGFGGTNGALVFRKL
jgi:3-oxoacyl-[acyl-carrier-protein] synthase II